MKIRMLESMRIEYDLHDFAMILPVEDRSLYVLGAIVNQADIWSSVRVVHPFELPDGRWGFFWYTTDREFHSFFPVLCDGVKAFWTEDDIKLALKGTMEAFDSNSDVYDVTFMVAEMNGLLAAFHLPPGSEKDFPADEDEDEG